MTPLRALAVLKRFMSDPPYIPPDLAQAILWLEAERWGRDEPQVITQRVEQLSLQSDSQPAVDERVDRYYAAIGSQRPPKSEGYPASTSTRVGARFKGEAGQVLGLRHPGSPVFMRAPAS